MQPITRVAGVNVSLFTADGFWRGIFDGDHGIFRENIVFCQSVHWFIMRFVPKVFLLFFIHAIIS